ncbi:MAG: GNAT family N-acetyltransferase [Planctomycetota bacterium]|jgi:CelD/BcsL family acetyltransferase involved in cellulose biosynthesis
MRAELGDPRPEDWRSVATTMDPERRFLAANWFAPWAETTLPHARWRAPLRHMVCRDADGTMVGVFPFATQVMAGLRTLSLGGRYYPFRSVPVDAARRDEACRAIVEGFERYRKGVALRFGLVGSDDKAIEALLRVLRERGWRPYLYRRSNEHVVDLPGTLDEYRAQVGAKIFKKAAYYERRMARKGEVRLEMYNGLDAAAWADVVRDIGAIEENSWLQRKGGTMFFSGAPNQAFWRAVLADDEASRMARVWILYFDGAPASHVFAIDSGPTRHFLANSYIESVSDHRTGSTLYAHVFSDAIERGLRSVNAGEGDAGYKAHWGAVAKHKLHDWIVLRPGLTGRLLHALLRWKRR